MSTVRELAIELIMAGEKDADLSLAIHLETGKVPPTQNSINVYRSDAWRRYGHRHSITGAVGLTDFVKPTLREWRLGGDAERKRHFICVPQSVCYATGRPPEEVWPICRSVIRGRKDAIHGNGMTPIERESVLRRLGYETNRLSLERRNIDKVYSPERGHILRTRDMGRNVCLREFVQWTATLLNIRAVFCLSVKGHSIAVAPAAGVMADTQTGRVVPLAKCPHLRKPVYHAVRIEI